MGLRHRPMLPSDVKRCVDIIASHPVHGPRYGSAIFDLPQAWLRLLKCEAKSAVVFEEVHAGRARIWGVGVSVFVTDGFLRELKTPPFFWIGLELTKRMVRGTSPVLSARELREANSRDGLNLLTWEGCICPEDMKRAEIYNRLMAAFMEEHRGYRWKEIIGSQAESVERFQSMLKSGGMLLSPDGSGWSDSVAGRPGDIIQRPHVIGLDRETEMRGPGSWAGTLFDYSPPQFGFSRSEQTLLIAAIRGGTDQDLSDELGISLSAVKKSWRTIYDRVSARAPELIPSHLSIDWWAHDRGKEKKQRLIAYLREHPEELRPTARKLLGQARLVQVRAAEGRSTHPAYRNARSKT